MTPLKVLGFVFIIATVCLVVSYLSSDTLMWKLPNKISWTSHSTVSVIGSIKLDDTWNGLQRSKVYMQTIIFTYFFSRLLMQPTAAVTGVARLATGLTLNPAAASVPHNHAPRIKSSTPSPASVSAPMTGRVSHHLSLTMTPATVVVPRIVGSVILLSSSVIVSASMFS